MIDLQECLNFIDPSNLDYNDWVRVGMALKYEGEDFSVWDTWSARDEDRYHQKEMFSKWESFNRGNSKQTTKATIIQMAIRSGYHPITFDENGVYKGNRSDINRLEDDTINFLKALYEPDEWVTITRPVYNDSKKKYDPKGGDFHFVSVELVEKLETESLDDIFDYDTDGGLWIVQNATNGFSRQKQDVTSYKYNLIENDTYDIQTQIKMLLGYGLPIATLTFSGGKSVHALVRIDAATQEQYDARVSFLYNYLSEQGFNVDRANSNHNRLTRLPGAKRGKNSQFLIDVNLGASSWSEWYFSQVHDSSKFKECANIEDIYNAPDNRPPALIAGVLLKGAKAILTARSKLGKSINAIEMSLCLSNGLDWLGFKCRKSKVLYIDLEVLKEEVYERIRRVGRALHIETPNDMEIICLRGQGVGLEDIIQELTIRYENGKQYDVIIIDPIYKLGLGNENDNEAVSQFCRQIDELSKVSHASVIYVHHHSKGAQSGKNAMDRGSGSGVFSRDADAIIDMLELAHDPIALDEFNSKYIGQLYITYINRFANTEWRSKNPHMNLYDLSLEKLETICRYNLQEGKYEEVASDIDNARASLSKAVPFEMSFIVRSFVQPDNIRGFFKYPLHFRDEWGILEGVQASDVSKNKKTTASKEARIERFQTAFDHLLSFHPDAIGVNKDEIAEYLGVTEKTIRNYLNPKQKSNVSDKYYYDKETKLIMQR